LATHKPVPPHTVVPAIPPRLSDLITRLLAKDPADRPRTAREVIDQLAVIQAELPKPAHKTQTMRAKLPAQSSRKAAWTARAADPTPVVPHEMIRGVPRGAPHTTGKRNKAYALSTLIAAGLLGCVLALVGGGVYYVATDTGIVEIVTEDADVRV